MDTVILMATATLIMDTRAAITGTEAGMAEADVAVGAIAKRNPIRSPGGISSAVLLL